MTLFDKQVDEIVDILEKHEKKALPIFYNRDNIKTFLIE